MIKILMIYDVDHSQQVLANSNLVISNSQQETDQVRVGRDKYCNKYETGHLVCRIKTVDFSQGIVVDVERGIE